MGMGMGSDHNWQAECDMRTLKEAEQIKNDQGRVAAAKKYAADQAKVMQDFAKKGPKKPAGF